MARLLAALALSVLHVCLAYRLPVTSLQPSVTPISTGTESGNGPITSPQPSDAPESGSGGTTEPLTNTTSEEAAGPREIYEYLFRNQTSLHGALVRSIERALGRVGSPLLSAMDIMLKKFLDEETANLSESQALDQCNGYLEQLFNGSTVTEEGLLVGCTYRMTCTSFDPELYPPILITGECTSSRCHPYNLRQTSYCNTDTGMVARLQFNYNEQQWEYLRHDSLIIDCTCRYFRLS